MEDYGSGHFAGPSKVQASPPPPRPARGLVKLVFDENTSTWIVVDHGILLTLNYYVVLTSVTDTDNYRLCYEIKMKCTGDDLDAIASYFLKQHVDKQKEILWSI